MVQSLRNFIAKDEVVYAAYAFLVGNEQSFNEQWFDVFLYYALIGLNKPSVDIRIYSLNVLNTIAKFNVESILEVTEKIHKLAGEIHWEIKVQCLEFAVAVLSANKNMSHLLDKKQEEVKAQKNN